MKVMSDHMSAQTAAYMLLWARAGLALAQHRKLPPPIIAVHAQRVSYYRKQLKQANERTRHAT